MSNEIALLKAPTKELAKSPTKDRLDSADCQEFARRFQGAVLALGLTQADVSRLTGLSRAAISLWWNGLTYPSVVHTKTLARFLRTSAGYLIYGEKPVDESDMLLDSIPVIDRVSGKQATITRIAIPKEFMAHAKMASPDKLRAVTIFSDNPLDNVNKGDIVIVDTSDRTPPAKKPGVFVLDNGEITEVGSVKMKKGNKMHVTMHGEHFDMPHTSKNVVGRVVAHLSAVSL